MADPKQPAKADDAETPKPAAPAIIEQVVERTLAPRHCARDIVDKALKMPSQKVRVARDFAEQHPEIFVDGGKAS